MRWRRQTHADQLSRMHSTTGEDDTHTTCLAHEIPMFVAIEYCSHQTRLPEQVWLVRVLSNA